MRYFFKANIEQQYDSYQIKIPFNVWEVSRKRGNIDGDMEINNKNVDCQLIPTNNNGRYKIKLSDEDVSKLGIFPIDNEHEYDILLHIGESLVKFEKVSPYSVENPIRKIDSVEIIIQPVDGLCSQTSIAMLAGVRIGDVVEIMGLREWQAKMVEMISALRYFGFEHSDTVIFTNGRDVTLPKCCIMMEKMALYCHYLIHFDGVFYDPNMQPFTEYDMSKLMGYLEVKT